MSAAAIDHEAIIIGAGLTGICQLYKLLEQDVDAVVLESADDLGGTWYHNRYPGCRFDSESYTYCYSFSEELLADWNWSEEFAPRAETLSYLNHVADRFDLRKHMRFGHRVEEAVWDDAAETWTVRLDDGSSLSCRFLISAIGVFSAPTLPEIEGMDSFEGPSFHTYNWPKEPVELPGRRVAVIGTGATAVQMIPMLAAEVDQLVVFQRRPNWCAPLHNREITAERMADIKTRYEEIFEECRLSAGGFLHRSDKRKMYEISEQERFGFYEELYQASGFRIWLGNFLEILMDEKANAEFSEFVANKIRERVNDPILAEKLIPTDHGFGTRRVPMETNFYEAFNQDNVTFVDLNDTPIDRITPNGIRTNDGTQSVDHEVDMIVYATGFEAMTGPFDRMDFIGRDGRKLRDKWGEGPVTYLGLQSAGFPNLVMLAGPQSAAGFSNFGRVVEETVDWVTDLLSEIRSRGATVIEPTEEAEADWCRHVEEMYDVLLLGKVKSWFTGYNTNVEGHDTRRLVVYNGGSPRYRRRLAEIAEEGYDGFVIS